MKVAGNENTKIKMYDVTCPLLRRCQTDKLSWTCQ